MTTIAHRAVRAALILAALAATAPAMASAAGTEAYGATIDTAAPVTTDDVPSGPIAGPVHLVTLTADDGGGSGVDRTYYTTDGSVPTTSSPVYDPDDEPRLFDGQRIRYFSVDAVGNTEQVRTSAEFQVRSDDRAETVATAESVPAGDAGSQPAAEAASADSRSPVARLSSLAVGPRCVVSASLGRELGGTTPLSLRYTLSAPATVHIVVARRNPSMKRTSCARVPLGRSKARYDTIGEQTLGGRSGGNETQIGTATAPQARAARRRPTRFELSRAGNAGRNVARIAAARRLRPGTYRVLAVAESPSGERSTVATAIFYVVGR